MQYLFIHWKVNKIHLLYNSSSFLYKQVHLYYARVNLSQVENFVASKHKKALLQSLRLYVCSDCVMPEWAST